MTHCDRAGSVSANLTLQQHCSAAASPVYPGPGAAARWLFTRAAPGRIATSAVYCSIGFTIGFHNHKEGPYWGLLLVESAY